MTHILTTDHVALAVSALALAGTAAGVVYTHLQLSLSRRVRREQLEPFIVVDIAPQSPASPMLNLIITNSGPTVARDVAIRVSPPLRTSLGPEYEVRLAAAVARKIPTLPPGRSIAFFVDTGFNIFDQSRSLPTVYTFEVDCLGPFGPVQKMTYIVDLGILEDSVFNKETVVGQLTEIAEKLGRIAESQNSLIRPPRVWPPRIASGQIPEETPNVQIAPNEETG